MSLASHRHYKQVSGLEDNSFFAGLGLDSDSNLFGCGFDSV